MNTLVTSKDIESVIKNLTTNKSPGPEASMINSNIKDLVSIFQKLSKKSKRKNASKLTLQGQHYLDSKPDKGNKRIKNCRPISLMNTHAKIFEKILTNKLKNISNGSYIKIKWDSLQGCKNG
jgi:hypothetical protein